MRLVTDLFIFWPFYRYIVGLNKIVLFWILAHYVLHRSCTMYDFYDSTDIFFYIHHFCHFVPKRYPELALKTGILVPKVE